MPALIVDELMTSESEEDFRVPRRELYLIGKDTVLMFGRSAVQQKHSCHVRYSQAADKFSNMVEKSRQGLIALAL